MKVSDAGKIIGKSAGNAKVTLGHDWLTGMRGGERVLEFFCEAFPDAEISTLLYNKEAMSSVISSHKVNPSFMNKIPGVYKNYRNMLPIMPMAARSLKIPKSDLLITTSHCVAKSFVKYEGSQHICVCFTPMRYAWTFFNEYFGNSPIKAMLIKPLLTVLRAWDKKTSSGVDKYVAISNHVAKRIKDFYGRESDVVYPAVDTERCVPNEGYKSTGDYDLIVSALVPYKRVDLAVELYTKTGMPLKVVGVGGCMEHLASIAGPNVELLGGLSDEDVLKLYQNCRMLLFPGEEDYGIVPLEAQSCGKPVVAYAKGGALETIKADETGVFFDEQSLESLEAAVEKCSKINFDPEHIRNHALEFGAEQFAHNMARCIKGLME